MIIEVKNMFDKDYKNIMKKNDKNKYGNTTIDFIRGKKAKNKRISESIENSAFEHNTKGDINQKMKENTFINGKNVLNTDLNKIKSNKFEKEDEETIGKSYKEHKTYEVLLYNHLHIHRSLHTVFFFSFPSNQQSSQSYSQNEPSFYSNVLNGYKSNIRSNELRISYLPSKQAAFNSIVPFLCVSIILLYFITKICLNLKKILFSKLYLLIILLDNNEREEMMEENRVNNAQDKPRNPTSIKPNLLIQQKFTTCKQKNFLSHRKFDIRNKVLQIERENLNEKVFILIFET